MKKNQLYKAIIEFLIGISFVMSVYANMISYYVTGNQNDLLRKGISWGIIVIIVVILGSYIIKKWFSSDKAVRKDILLYLSPLLINGVLLVWALAGSGGNSIVFKQCLSFSAYCIPVVCGAIYIVLEKRFDAVASKIKYVMLTMLPYYCISLLYFGSMTVASRTPREVGGVVYLSIGYSVIPLYACLLYDLIQNFMADKKSKTKIGLILLEMVLGSLMAIISSSRGVLIGWFLINLVAVVIMLAKKQRKAMLGVAVSIASVLIFCIAAPADNMVLGRQFAFINDLKQGKLEQSLKSEEGQQLLNDLYEQADGEQGLLEIALGISKEVNGESQTSDDISVDENYKDALESVTTGSMARSYLWQLAIKEMKQSPLTGIGPMGYQQKYGSHAHNILLECLADFGIIACAVLGVACVAAVVLLIKKGFQDWKYCGVLMLISGEIVRAMLSGNLYVCPFLLFTLVIATEIVLKEHKAKRLAENA